MNEFTVTMICLVACFIMGIFIGLPYPNEQELINKMYEEVAKCEEALPRNQRCEYVITARVKEKEDERSKD